MRLFFVGVLVEFVVVLDDGGGVVVVVSHVMGGFSSNMLGIGGLFEKAGSGKRRFGFENYSDQRERERERVVSMCVFLIFPFLI